MGQVVRLRPTNQIEDHAKIYVKMYLEQGWYAAGKYMTDCVPRQFWPQIKNCVEQELVKRGIEVHI